MSMDWSDVPIIGNMTSLFNKDGTEVSDSKISETMFNSASESELKNAGYGKDCGDITGCQVASAGAGAFAGFVITNKLSGGNKLQAVIGALAGAVIMHKIGPELITDVQRANQAVDQQKDAGKSEGKLSDRFAATIENIKVRGQAITPDADPDINM